MAIAAGITVMWPGTAGTIPAGWNRVATLDGRYVKGTAAGVDPDVTGGALTHTHVDPGHDHSIAAHTHTATNLPVPNNGAGLTSNAGGANPNDQHTHSVGAGGSTASTSGSSVATWGTASNEPAYRAVIWIASDGTPAGLPDGAWAMWNDAGGLPTSWTHPANGKNYFPKGAAAAGDGGGSGGGGSHDHADAGHTHIWNGHSHTGVTSAAQSGGTNTGGSTTFAQTVTNSATHTHSAGSGAGSGSTAGNSAASANTGSATYEPPYTKLAIVQNGTGGADTPSQIIAIWLGLLSAIPAGWVLCDGNNGTTDMRGQFLKGANTLAEIGDAGGAVGHSHTSPAGHTHAYNHTHIYTTGASSSTATVNATSGPPGVNLVRDHQHQGNTNAATGTSGSTVATAPSTADTQPPFRTVAFIQFALSLVPTITDPTGTITEPAFTAEWTLAYDPAGGAPVQEDYRYRIFEDDGITLVYDSGTIASATQEHVMGTWSPENNTTYIARVDVTDDLGITGFDTQSFMTSWTPPDTVAGLTVTPFGGV